MTEENYPRIAAVEAALRHAEELVTHFGINDDARNAYTAAHVLSSLAYTEALDRQTKAMLRLAEVNSELMNRAYPPDGAPPALENTQDARQAALDLVDVMKERNETLAEAVRKLSGQAAPVEAPARKRTFPWTRPHP